MFKTVKKSIIALCLFSTTTAIFAQKLPDTKVKTMEDKSVSIQSLAPKGKVTVISFWATWCVPCQKELDEINKNYSDWQKKDKFNLVAVSIDDEKAAAKLKTKVAEKKWKFAVVKDPTSDLKKALNFPSVPYTIVVDKKGNIAYTHSGYKAGDEKELKEKVAALNKE